MKAFVINLACSKGRRTRIQQHLEGFGIPFEFFEGVDGKALSKSYVARVYDSRKALRVDCALNPGELGCALSHMGIYEKMIKEGIGEALIFEDDATVVSKNFSEIIKDRKKWLPPDAELVLLGYRVLCPMAKKRWKAREDLRRVDADHRVGKMYAIASGSYGYYITFAGAKKILKKSTPILHAMDNVTGDAVIGKHHLYAIQPPLMVFTAVESTISAGQKQHKKLFLRHSFRRMIIDYRLPAAPFYWITKIKKQYQRFVSKS